MIPPLLLVTGAALLILCLVGGAKGATPPRPSNERTAVPGAYKATEILRRYASLLARYNAPMPPPALALIIQRESGGSPSAIARGMVDGGSELGLTQLTVEHTGTSGEAQLADVDPLTPAGAIFGVQHEYDRIRERLTETLADFHYDEITSARDWIVLMHLARSIGLAGTKTILNASRHDDSGNAVAAIRALANGPTSAIPRVGRQTPELVQKRLKRAVALPDDAATLGPLPSELGRLPERGDDVPHFDRGRAMNAIGVAT